MAILSARTTSRLLVSAIALVPACYAPDLEDCAVSCTSAAECAGDQACADGWCSASGVSCTAQNVGMDAAVTPPDGDVPPVDAPIDTPPASPTVTVTVRTMGEGTIRVQNVGDCPSSSQPCTFTVPKGARDFIAIATRLDKPFESWTSQTCAGQNVTCSVNLTTDTTVSAKFH